MTIGIVTTIAVALVGTIAGWLPLNSDEEKDQSRLQKLPLIGHQLARLRRSQWVALGCIFLFSLTSVIVQVRDSKKLDDALNDAMLLDMQSVTEGTRLVQPRFKVDNYNFLSRIHSAWLTQRKADRERLELMLQANQLDATEKQEFLDIELERELVQPDVFARMTRHLLKSEKDRTRDIALPSPSASDAQLRSLRKDLNGGAIPIQEAFKQYKLFATYKDAEIARSIVQLEFELVEASMVASKSEAAAQGRILKQYLDSLSQRIPLE